MADREGEQSIDALEKKRDDLVAALGRAEHRAIELRAGIEALTRAIMAEIRHRREDGIGFGNGK